MSINDILAAAMAAGVYLYVDNDKLKYKVKTGGLPASLVPLLKTNKAALIERLVADEQKAKVEQIQLVDRSEDLPLSFAQQRLWFLHQLHGANNAYNIVIAGCFAEDTNVELLSLALQQVVARNEVLRTRFGSKGDTPIQYFESQPFAIEVESVGDESALRQAYFAEQNYRFELEQERLCRIRLLKQDNDPQVVLLACFHHSIFDGWSVGIFVRQVTDCYQALSQGQAIATETSQLQYADFANWQRGYLQGEVLHKQVDFWAKQLSGLPPLLSLPCDRPRKVQQSHPGDRLSFSLSTDLSERLLEFSQQQGASLFMTLIGAFSCLLSRYCNSTDIPIGTPIANRNREQIEGLMGFFANTLVLRHDLSAGPNFITLLQQVRSRALDAYAHQDVPFEKLVEALNPERSSAHSPFFQVMFALQNMQNLGTSSESIASNLDFSALSFAAQNQQELKTARFDLTLVMHQTQHPQGMQLSGEFEYSTDLFDRQTIIRISRHFENLLQLLLDNPKRCVNQLDFIDQQDKQLLASDSFKSVAVKPLSLAHTDFADKSNNLAAVLKNAGVIQGEPVGVLLNDALDKLVAICAIHAIGGHAVLIGAEFPNLRQQAIIADAGIKRLISDGLINDHCDSGAGVLAADLIEIKVNVAPHTGDTINPAFVELAPDSAALSFYPLSFDGVLAPQTLTHEQLSTVFGSDCDDFAHPQARLFGFELPAEASLFNALADLYHGRQRQLNSVNANQYHQALLQSAEDCSGLNFPNTITCSIVDERQQLVPQGGVGRLSIDGPYSAVLAGSKVRRATDGSYTLISAHVQQLSSGAARLVAPSLFAEGLKALDGVSDALVVTRQIDHQRFYYAYIVSSYGAKAEHMQGQIEAQWRAGQLALLPDKWIVLDKLPLDSQGEVDYKALPSVEQQQNHIAPDNDTESTLFAVWAEVLGFTSFGTRDNFFALGGDSILSIQVVSRARAQGLTLTVADLFNHPTIAELANNVSTNLQSFDQSPSSGEMPLLPIHQWFLNDDFGPQSNEQYGKEGNLNHFHQSQLLAVDGDFTLEFLTSFVSALIKRHDALRLIFSPQAEFKPIEQCPVEDYIVHQPLAHLGREAIKQHIADFGQQVKQGILLARGPLFKAVLFDTANSDSRCLLLVLHHLIVDGVSWRILLADMQSAYQAYSAMLPSERPNKPLTLGMKTTSYQHFSEQVQQFDASQQLAFWQQQLSTQQLPVDNQLAQGDERDTFGQAQKVTISLSQANTKALLASGGTYRTQIQELLLCGLHSAFARWTGHSELTVLLEGHGRESSLFAGTDLTETIGWFTTLYPLKLVADDSDLGIKIKGIKEQCRAVPDNGFGFGVLHYLQQAWRETEQTKLNLTFPIVFNYFGQFDGQLGEDALFAPIGIDSGDDFDANRVRHYQLGFNGSVIGGQLQFSIDYCPLRHNQHTIETLGQYFVTALNQIVEHCAAPQTCRFTPSDFPLAKIDTETLDKWQQRYTQLEDIYPLTGMQLGMVFHSLLDDNQEAYATQVFIDFEGNFDFEVFKRSWDILINHYPVFRCAYPGRDRAQPLQLVCSHAQLEWQYLDWRDESNQTQLFEQYRRDDKTRGFDFDQPPLMRMAMIQMAPKGWRWMWTHHHSILDGWSFSLVFTQLLNVYLALREGRTPKLPVVSPYRDYVGFLESIDMQKAEQYWQGQLQGVEDASNLPIQKPIVADVADGQLASGELKVVLSAEQTARLSDAAKHHSVTLNTLFQAGWAKLLTDLTHQTSIVFGQTIAGRPVQVVGVEQMVGLFINTIAVNVAVEPNQSLSLWLQGLHQAQVEREDFGYLSLNQLTRIAQLPQGQSLFNTLLVFENYPEAEDIDDGSEQGFEITGLDTNEGAHFDVTLRIGVGVKLVLHLDYNPELFAAEAIAQLVQNYQTVLTQLCDFSLQKVGQLQCVNAQHRQQQRKWWKGDDNELEFDTNLARLFEYHAANSPDAIAVIAQQQSLTYAQLNQQANQLAGYLRSKGVGPDVVVGICAERSLTLVIGIIAIIKAGGCYMPLDPDYPESRLDNMLQRSGCRLVLSESHLLEQLEVLFDYASFALDNPLFAGLLNKFSQGDEDPTILHRHHLAYLIYTSGSTGVPKGSAITHHNVHRLVRGGFAQLNQHSKVLCAASPSFDAFTFEFWGALLNGGTAVLADIKQIGFDGLAQLIDSHQIDTAWLTSALFNRIVDSRIESLTGLRQLLVGGEALSVAHVSKAQQQLPNTQLINGYGPTENTTFSCTWAVDSDTLTQHHCTPIGQPIAHSGALVLGIDLQILPVGAIGRLYLSGEGLARGYYLQPGLTAAHFIPHPYTQNSGERLYDTGDLARYMPDGNIEFVGRLDGQVKIRGFRIELAEIAELLQQHNQVLDASVQVLADEQGNPKLVAYVVFEPQFEVNQYQVMLADFAREKLPDYMVPVAWLQLEQLPLNANGKVDLNALPSPDWQADSGDNYVAPQTDIELKLAALWQQNLQLEKVGVMDNYFTLGGDSIRSIALVSDAKEQQLEFSVKDLFSAPTIQALAEIIAAGQTEHVEVEQDIDAFSLVSEDEMSSLMDQFNIEV